MRNRTPQPAPLDLPPVNNDPIRIYGQLFGPMGQPLAGLRILLKAITTTAVILQETWSESTVDLNGNYDFSVMPGKYAVFFERRGRKERVNNIYVYSDSAPGTLQSFMLAPAADMLTPLMVLEVKASLEEATAAMLRARQWAENPVDVPVLDFEQGAGPEFSAYHWAHYAEELINTDTNINWRGEWDSTTQYAFRDAVRYQGSSYYCIEGNTGTVPPDITTADNAAWSLMSAKGDKGNPGDASTVPGPAGPPNVLTIGEVTTVDYGAGSSATITGSAPNQVLNLQLERGPAGSTPDLSAYLTINDANTRFIQGIRLGPRVHIDHIDDLIQTPAGNVVTSLSGDSDNDVEGEYAPIEYNLNGAWGTIPDSPVLISSERDTLPARESMILKAEHMVSELQQYIEILRNPESKTPQ